ncbi:MAG: glycosyltransferase family 2 protein [Prevotella sp.]|nr:glycosyltransferase family 2 protein [Prevotella sp.]
MISIIIPAYNCEQYIEQCLDSILAQSYHDLQVICVEDCSTDGTLELIEQYVAKDARVKLIRHTHNQGMSASRNDGIAISEGEWLMLLDSDDWIDRDTCQQALEAARRHQADTVAWCYTREFMNKSLPKVFVTEEQVWEEKDIHQLNLRMIGPLGAELGRPDLMDAWVTAWGKLYSRKLVVEGAPLQYVDTKMIGTAEDALFNIEYFARAKKVVWLPQPFNHYRKDMLSSSNRHRKDLPDKCDLLYEMMGQCVEKLQLGDDARKALQNRIALSVLGLGIIAMRGKGRWMEKYKSLYQLLRRDRQRQALAQLELHHFPVHWRLFYFSAKHRLTPLFMAMQLAIGRIINKDQ